MPDGLTITTLPNDRPALSCTARSSSTAALRRVPSWGMPAEESRIVESSRVVGASAASVFRLIAEPGRHAEWDGNDNVAHAAPGQGVRAVGDVFAATLTTDAVRENHVSEFVDDRLIAWRPSEEGKPPVGHVWRWEIEAIDDASCRVTHTYDWTEMFDETRYPRARATTASSLAASIERLAAIAEKG